MRQSQLPFLGLLLAVFFGSRISLPSGQSVGTSAAGESRKAGSAHQPAKTPIGSSKQPSTKQPSTAVKAAPSNSPLLQTICRLNAQYNRSQAMNKGFPSQASPVAPTPFPDCLPHLSDQQTIHILSLMAAIEDPIHTHLGLETDRTIDAIQTAAAAASYNPYSHFLPWRPAEATSNGEETTDGESDLHQPGLLIFRKDVGPVQPAEYLAVFLIPELPTTGLDQEAFFVAQKIMADTNVHTGQIGKDSQIIRFAGPNFSGSTESFADIDRVLHNSQQGYSIHAFSGSITSPPDCASRDINGAVMLNQPSACADGTLQPMPVDVRTDSTLRLTQTSDRDAIYAFLSGVQEYGYCPEQIAILSEEGTEFGNELGRETYDQDKKDTHQPCQIAAGPLFLHFPREISKLRNAYGAQAGQTPQTGKTTQTGSSQPDISVNWQDSEASRGDDVPAYGGQQSPLSQLAALSSLPGILRRQNIKALGILATDPMDEAFLIRSFKKSSRDVRLFLRDPDLLYLRALDAGSLNGTLLVSNYPLIPQNQFWSADEGAKEGNQGKKDVVTFPSALQEAQYDAFLVLLEDMGIESRPPGRVESNWPAGSQRPSEQIIPVRPFPPPLWLATVGTAGHLPLKILTAPPIEENKLALRSLDVGAPHYTTIALCIVFAMLGFLHVWGLCFPSALPKLIAYDFYVIASTKSITASKALCHAAALSILALVQLILGSSFVFFGNAASPYGWLKWLVIVDSSVLMLVAFSVVYAIGVFHRKNRIDRGEGKLIKRRLYGSCIVVGVLAAIGACWAWSVFPVSYRNAFMHVRDLSLVGGVAPCFPIALMLLIAYFGCWAYLRRLTYWDYRKPKLPAVALDDVLPSDFNSEGGKMQGIDRCLLGLLENPGWSLILGLTFVLGILAFRPWTTLDMVEPRPIWWITFILFMLALFVLELNWFRFLNIWSLLRDILEDLERLPIHAGFQRMPTEKSMPILRGGVSDSSFLPPAQSVDRIRALACEDDMVVDALRVAEVQTAIHNLGEFKDQEMKTTCVWSSLAASWSSLETEIFEMPRAVNAAPMRFGGSRGRRQPDIVSATPNTLVELVQETGESVAELVQELILFLRPDYWRRGSDGSKLTDLPPPALRKFILAEDLVALRYYNYIRYVVNELRNLLFFVAIAFSLLFLAFHVYAFRADEAIDSSFLFLFVIFGGGIFLVLYQMEVDPILSHFGGSKPGEVGRTFYLDLLKYGAVPALTIIGAHVPMVSNFLLGWLQPTLESMH